MGMPIDVGEQFKNIFREFWQSMIGEIPEVTQQHTREG